MAMPSAQTALLFFPQSPVCSIDLTVGPGAGAWKGWVLPSTLDFWAEAGLRGATVPSILWVPGVSFTAEQTSHQCDSTPQAAVAQTPWEKPGQAPHSLCLGLHVS